MSKFVKSKHHFYLLFPNIFGFKGGIQVYSAFLLRALQHLYPEAKYNIFLKYDHSIPSNSPFLPQTQFYCFGKWPRLLQSILLTLKTLLLGLQEKPTLLIATHINYSTVCYWLKRLTGTPYWVVVHGLEAWNLDHPQLQKALRSADKVIAVSHYSGDRIVTEQNLDPKQVAVLPNTFEASRFSIAPKPQYLLKRYGLTPEQPIILTVTRLGRSTAQGKGYRQILEALVQVRHHIPNVHYLLAGKGDDASAVQSLIVQLNLTDCVTLTGFIPDDELCDYYNLCDVFTLTSSIEGFGIVYLEALACGKPVLAGNRDGAQDPMMGGQLGCLVDPDDVEAIAENLIQILQGTYPHAPLYQREVLRQQTIDRFEFAQFQRTLETLTEATHEQLVKSKVEKAENAA